MKLIVFSSIFALCGCGNAKYAYPKPISGFRAVPAIALLDGAHFLVKQEGQGSFSSKFGSSFTSKSGSSFSANSGGSFTADSGGSVTADSTRSYTADGGGEASADTQQGTKVGFQINPDLAFVERSGASFETLRQTRPQSASEIRAAILRQEYDLSGNSYSYLYETENGISAQETGQVNDGTEAQGSFSYTGDDGVVYSIKYTAGVNGFIPQGAHLPTPPPVPEEILRSLESNARDEANGIFDDGSYREESSGGGFAQVSVLPPAPPALLPSVPPLLVSSAGQLNSASSTPAPTPTSTSDPADDGYRY